MFFDVWDFSGYFWDFDFWDVWTLRFFVLLHFCDVSFLRDVSSFFLRFLMCLILWCVRLTLPVSHLLHFCWVQNFKLGKLRTSKMQKSFCICAVILFLICALFTRSAHPCSRSDCQNLCVKSSLLTCITRLQRKPQPRLGPLVSISRSHSCAC